MNVPATRLRQALRELNRRRQQAHIQSTLAATSLAPPIGDVTGDGDRVLAHLFDKQRAVILDPAKKKSARCGRRSGKTTGPAAAYLVREALNRAGALTGYITTTRKHAKRLIWKELKRLDRHYGLNLRYNETDLIVTFPNGSEIWVAGADKTDQIEKFRGVAFVLVVIDESASFKAHIEELVREVIEPTLEDFGGSVLMIGTPGRVCAGLFYEVTTADDGWSRHHWTVLDNPMFPRWRGHADWQERAKAWLAELKRKNGWDKYEESKGEPHPVFLREWMARWVRDVGSLVYRWDPVANGYKWAQADRDGHDWRFILGVDLGNSPNAVAFTLVAYSIKMAWCYLERSWKRTGMDITDTATEIKKLRKERYISKTVVDCGGLGKMIVEEMRKRHHLPLEAAEKKDKAAFQETMNADLLKGLVRVDQEACAQLIAEWEELQKDENGDEDERFDNDCSDSALYAWREARHYVWKPKPAPPKPGTPEHFAQLEREIQEADEADLQHDEVEELFA